MFLPFFPCTTVFVLFPTVQTASLKLLSRHNHCNLVSRLGTANIALLIPSQKAAGEILSPAIPCPHPIAGLPRNSKPPLLPAAPRVLPSPPAARNTLPSPLQKLRQTLRRESAAQAPPKLLQNARHRLRKPPATKSCECGQGGCCDHRAPECPPAVDYYYFLRAHIKQQTTSFSSELGQHGDSTAPFTIPQALPSYITPGLLGFWVWGFFFLQ